MNYLNKVDLVSLLLLLAVSNELKRNHTGSTSVSKSTGDDNHCNNDSTCPTWFICSAEKRCHCDNRHTDKIVCNNNAQISRVLNCNCVTYDNLRTLGLASTTVRTLIHPLI